MAPDLQRNVGEYVCMIFRGHGYGVQGMRASTRPVELELFLYTRIESDRGNSQVRLQVPTTMSNSCKN